MAVRFVSSSSKSGLDEMLRCESLSLSHVLSIKHGALRFFDVGCEEEVSRDRVCLIKNRCLRCRHASTEAHWAYLISVVITL